MTNRLLHYLTALPLIAIFASVSAAFPGQNGKIAFNLVTFGASRIATINPDGSGETILTEGPSDYIPRWSPDGSRIAFSRGSDVFIMNGDGTNQTQLTFGTGYNRYPTFSPDGTKIIYLKGNLGIWQVNADGSGAEIRLADLAYDICAIPGITYSAYAAFGATGQQADSPDWSPDGEKIVFDITCGFGNNPNLDLGNINVYTINADGSNLTPITNYPAIPNTNNGTFIQRWSPDGSKLLFNYYSQPHDLNPGGTYEYSVLIANADGSNLSTLIGPTSDGFYDLLAWSPDGTKIVYDAGPDDFGISNSNFINGLYVMNADGTNITRITDNLAGRFFPDWQPIAPSYTQQGTNVSVVPLDTTNNTVPLSLTFSTVTQTGTTSLNSSNQGPSTPSGFQVGSSGLYYDVSTTAQYSGFIDLCFRWTQGEFFDESTVRLFHYENNSWADVTTSLDTDNNKVCGRVSSLSPFALFENVRYNFAGFYPPVNNYPTRNSVKAGSGVPVKFSLGGNQGLNIFSSGYPVSQSVACNNNAPVDAVEQTVTAGGSSLSFDAASGQYTYVWKTDKNWGNSCRRLTLKFSDGSSRIADFVFTK